jgi:hypothetical protein
MKLGDLKNPFFIHLKGILFFFLIVLSGLYLFLSLPKFEIFIFILVLIWSSSRFYYYLFYVIEKYIDPNYKFSGIYSALKYFLVNK